MQVIDSIQEFDAELVADYLHVAPFPISLRGYSDNSAWNLRRKPELEQAYRGHRSRVEIDHDKVGLRLFVELPQDLLAIWLEGDVLTPGAVPICAMWVENSYRMLIERGG